MISPLPPHVSLLLLLLISINLPYRQATELIATYEWQKVGDTDTLPAGLEIRMDLGTEGGKWARLPPKEINPPNSMTVEVPHNNEKRCDSSCRERQKERAENRRKSGFMLREAPHSRRQQEIHGSENFSVLHEAGLFLVGLTLGLGVASRFRRRASGEHES